MSSGQPKTEKGNRPELNHVSRHVLVAFERDVLRSQEFLRLC